MNNMTKIKNILIPVLITFSLTGCSLMGLDLQEDYNRSHHSLDPHVNTTTWDYLKSRNYVIVTDTIIDGTTKSIDTVKIDDVAALSVNFKTQAQAITAAKPTFPITATAKFGRVLKADTIFTLMIQGIRYSEIDTNEYRKTDRTIIVLHNDAIRRLSAGKPYTDCIFGAYFVNNAVVPQLKWTGYPKEFVKKYFEYLILLGQYSHSSMKDTTVNTLLTTTTPLYFQHLPTGITQPGNATLPPGTVTSGTIPAFIDGGLGAEPNPGSNVGTLEVAVINTSPSNTSDYPVRLNNYLNVRTSDIIADGYDDANNYVKNSVIVQVIDRFLTTNMPY
jgi:hypothetical protein